jgi:hypothetical protein
LPLANLPGDARLDLTGALALSVFCADFFAMQMISSDGPFAL